MDIALALLEVLDKKSGARVFDSSVMSLAVNASVAYSLCEQFLLEGNADLYLCLKGILSRLLFVILGDFQIFSTGRRRGFRCRI